ncbi:Ubiquitinyl hydrolase 1 [Handroanthus impetiginosus]|uniref:Ubiquitinyl hydrolase 1 n=1 Tax=Handroanthus impetiginosus TaxID=429701 RepID=A0A2G9I874_9LAMI|nr:Ubiquitinyl hydrolase 1 [Handroanthus impetiginosus]
MGEFASSIATYSFLVQEMRKCVGAGENRKKYLDGCTVGLMAWLYERITSLGTTQKLIEFFRLYRWGECKLPRKVHDAEDRLKSITADMIMIYILGYCYNSVFEFNPTRQELCLVTPDSVVAVIVRAKDQEINELKKRVVELEIVANKDVCVLAPVKADAAATKEQRDHEAACKEQSDNDGKENERKDEEEEDEKDKEMDKERNDGEDEEEEEKVEENEQKEEKTDEGQDDKKCEKEDGEDDEGKEKEGEKDEERKDGDDDEERDHDADNENNDMNEENQTKHRAGQVLYHHEVEMNKKLEAISRKLDFGQDVNFGEQDYEAVRTLLSIIDNELIEKQKLEDFDSPLSTTPAKHAKQRNEESDHGEEKRTILEQEKTGPKKEMMEEVTFIKVGEESDVNESPRLDPFGGRKDYRGRDLIMDEERGVIDRFVERDNVK